MFMLAELDWEPFALNHTIADHVNAPLQLISPSAPEFALVTSSARDQHDMAWCSIGQRIQTAEEERRDYALEVAAIEADRHDTARRESGRYDSDHHDSDRRPEGTPPLRADDLLTQFGKLTETLTKSVSRPSKKDEEHEELD
ncbi:unknown protein [Seminavis robusta]|uniref:Uncharacterized protein n=1 Tax=Seminavis robusta TaxID=568900 RepID=A0A9N8H4U9_9STRA|nr:unknown protein [Seminavis robusta]|eukprot:Sro71_g039610.1 n/a (142) ;mRNA; f:133400-133825